MIAAEDCTLILLAAGRSTRFGADNKLEADLDGRPVALHVVDALAGIAFKNRIAVVGDGRLDYAARGYRIVRNPAPERGLSSSIRLGVAQVGDAAAVLIVLADMPRVTERHVRRLLDTANGSDAVIVSSDGTQPSPPALFGRAHFDHLLSLEGDAGARRMVATGLRIETNSTELADIDTAEQLNALSKSSPSIAWGGGPLA